MAGNAELIPQILRKLEAIAMWFYRRVLRMQWISKFKENRNKKDESEVVEISWIKNKEKTVENLRLAGLTEGKKTIGKH